MDFGWRNAAMCESERKILREFIEAYRKNPALWCLKSPEYCNKTKKQEAYKILLQIYRQFDPNATVEDVKKKLNIMRTNYRREFKKMMLLNSLKGLQGSVDRPYKPSLWYFDELNFLNSEENLRVDFTRHSTVNFPKKYCRRNLYEQEVFLPSAFELNADSANLLCGNVDEEYLPEGFRTPIETNDAGSQKFECSNQMDPEPICNLEEISPLSQPQIKCSLSPPSKTRISIRKRKRKSKVDKKLLHVAQELVKSHEDEYEAMARAWAIKIRKMEPQQRLFAEKAINDVLFEGQLCTLGRNSININPVTSSSHLTPSSSSHVSQ